MGARGQIISHETTLSSGEVNDPIYFYTHWGRDRLPQVLANALDRVRNMWNDPAYLNRVIFSELVKDEFDGTTGYGISSNYQDSSKETDWHVWHDTNTIVTPDSESLTFEEFIKKYKE